MAVSNKPTSKIAAILCTVASFLVTAAGSNNTLPTAQDVNHLAERARLTTDTFMQESFELRMKFEYYGKFLTEKDQNNLHQFAKKTGNDLQAIAEKQQELKKQIEDYQGSDWDDRFGSTGLWRKLSGNIYATELAKCEIDYYFGLTVDWSPLNKTLEELRERIISLDTAHSSPNSQLLKAKILALARIDSAWNVLATDIINSLIARPDVPETIYFRAAIEKLKLAHLKTPESLNSLVQKLAQSSCSDDFELVLSLALLQRRYDPGGFEKTINLFPQTKHFLGSLFLSDLSRRIEDGRLTEQTIQQVSVFEAELAAQAAWNKETKNYKTLLKKLAGQEKFQTPLILYVTAIALAESSPANAVELLIKASKLQNLQKSKKLDIKAYKIAEQSAQLAYNLLLQKENNCQLILEAFENYLLIAGKRIDEELEYLYSIILNDCGQTAKSKELLEKIANRPNGYRRNRTKLDLILQQIQQNKAVPDKTSLFTELSNLIAACSKQEQQIKEEATAIYCQLLLESKDKESAQEILNILTDVNTQANPGLNIFKAKALQRLGRLDESADCLVETIELNACDYKDEPMALLSEIVDKIDSLEVQVNNFPKMMQDCKQLAQSCHDCLNGQEQRQAGLFLAEVSVFAAAKKQEKLSAVVQLLDTLAKDASDNDIDLLRCRARLLTKQGKFDKAGRLWSQICEIRKNELTEANQRSAKWWRAKFYELYCFSKLPQTQKEEVLHTIEVLENSFTNIPLLWAEKLNLLKEVQLHNNLSL
ncbi:MAG: hypothetical protein JSV82_00060 [Planctomycetota bacterium]|nr:MAG: hypothetical protein JSV82_00060 [Planctomycetota bacterium]